MRKAVYGALAFLYVVHTDVWFWDDPRPLLGLPVGLAYHVIWTLAVSATFWLAVKYAWPQDLETTAPGGERAGSAADIPSNRDHDGGVHAGRRS